MHEQPRPTRQFEQGAVARLNCVIEDLLQLADLVELVRGLLQLLLGQLPPRVPFGQVQVGPLILVLSGGIQFRQTPRKRARPCAGGGKLLR